jgi:multiple sugar transport system substrate-binding protein
MKKIVSLVLVFAMCMSLLVFSANAESASEPITITFWNSWTGSDGDQLIAMVEKFNEENPYGITVDMTITASFGEMMQTALPTGQAADLVLNGGVEGFNTYDGYFVDIGDIWDNTSLEKEDFLSSYLDMCYKDGVQYGVPFQASVIYYYWNKDLFEASGLDPEKPATTYDEYTQYAAQITDPEKQIYGSGLFYSFGWHIACTLFPMSGYMVREGEEPDTFSVHVNNNEGLKNGMLWMHDLFANGYNPVETNNDPAMIAGMIGQMLNGMWLKPGLDAAGINYGMAKIPVLEGDSGDNYALGGLATFAITTSASDEAKVAAERFIEWWYKGNEGTDVVDTAVTSWSTVVGFTSVYVPTIETDVYQSNELLATLSVLPGSDVQTGVIAPTLCLAYSDIYALWEEFIAEWNLSEGGEEYLDELLDFYQEEFENAIIEHYGEAGLVD